MSSPQTVLVQQRLASPVVRLSLLVAALILAFTGQFLFTGEWFTHRMDSNNWEWLPAHSLALGCMLAALALAALSAWLPRIAWSGAMRAPTTLPRSVLGEAGAAIGLSLLTSILYLMFDDRGSVRLLWVTSVLVLSVGLALTTPRMHHPRVPMRELVAIGMLTLIAGGLRFWQLTSIPDQLDNDVFWIGMVAREQIAAGNENWIGYSIPAGHLQSYVQFHAWGLRLFGDNRLGLVINAAIAGTLTIPVLYALGRELISARIGLIAAALLTFSYTHIHFSRTMFGVSPTLFATLTFWLIARGLRRGEVLWFALSGLSAGIGLLVYDSGRVVPVITLAILGWCLIWDRQLVARHRANLGLFALGLVIGFGPNLAFMLRDFSLFQGRASDVPLWSPQVWEHQTRAYGVTSVVDVLRNQVARAFLTFYLYGDRSPQFAFPRPVIMPLTAVLLTVGVGAALAAIRHIRPFLLIAWVLLTLILGGVITYDPPFWPHLVIALPAVMLLAAYGADTVLSTLADLGMARSVQVGQWILAGALLLSGMESWQIYHDYTSNNAGPRTRISRVISMLPTGYTVYLISDELTPDMFIFQFNNRETPIKNLPLDNLIDELPADAPRLFVLHQRTDVLPQLQQAYADGALERYTDRDQNELFVTYRVGPPPERELSAQGASTFVHWLMLLVGFLLGWAGHTIWAWTRRRAGGVLPPSPHTP